MLTYVMEWYIYYILSPKSIANRLQICDGIAAFCEGFSLDRDAFMELSNPMRRDNSFSIHEIYGAYALRDDIKAVNIAVLDLNISQHLRNITKLGVHKIRAFINKSDDCEKMVGNTSSTSTKVPLLLVLYGGRGRAQVIGRSLSNARIYLQHPISIESDIPYENPHYYQATTTAKLIGSINATNIAQPVVQTALPPQSIIEEVFQTLEREKPLLQVEPDIRVHTKLLPYVKFRFPFYEC